MTDCEAAKYFDKFKLVPREMACKSSRNSSPTNAIQNGGQLGVSANTEDLNRLKLLKLQENGDQSQLQQTRDDMELFRKPNLGAEGISTLMERAENRHRALARKKADGIEDASEPINETLGGRMNRLEAYLHRIVQATEGVSRNILKQKNMLPTLGTAMAEQIHSSNINYSKQSPTKASSPYKANISRKMPKLATKPYTITPAERVKTIHRKVKKGPDFMYGKGFNDIFSKKGLSHSYSIPQSWETVL